MNIEIKSRGYGKTFNNYKNLIQRDYIHKDKIREKIKELEKKRDEETLTITSALFQRDINTLQDLLGDEK